MAANSRMTPRRSPVWWLVLFIVTASGVLQFGMPATGQWLRLEPDLIRAGEVWRLFSGHFLHLSWSHYALNVAAFIAICGLFAESLTVGALFGWIVVSALAVGFGVLWFEPELGWYVGLSGVLHGLLTAASLRALGRRELIGGFTLLAVSLKLAWEQVYGPMPGSEASAGGAVIVNAHLYGALGGVVAAAAQGVARLARRFDGARSGAE